MVDNATRVIGSFASRQGKLGAAMHNAAYTHLKENLIYIPFAVTDCKNAVAGMRALNFRGAAVSMPHKEEVMKYLDKINPVAKAIGAVNTISNDDGILTGYNSDWIGAMRALEESCDLSRKTVVLLGAGGAARAIAYGLQKNHARVHVYNRTRERAIRLAREFGLASGKGLGELSPDVKYDILINATSAGFADQENVMPIEDAVIHEKKVVMDVVYKPVETLLLRCAKRKKCTIIPGNRMILHQAVFQVELFTGKKAPLAIMENALRACLV